MGIRVTALRIKDKFKPLDPVNWLLSSIGEKLTIEVDIDVEEIVTTEADTDVDRILFNPSVGQAGTTNTDDLIMSELGNAFANISIGDTITIVGSITPAEDGDYLVYAKPSTEQIRVTTTVGGAVVFTAGIITANGYLYVATPFAGITYFYNFIENQAATTYENAISGELQRLSTNIADATDTVTEVPLNFEGSKSYRYGSATIRGRGVVTSIQSFTITHETIVTPLFLSNQYDDFTNDIAPDYYLNGNTLRYITEINAGRTLTDPNTIQDTSFDELDGNTSWYNENNNGGDTNYYIESTTYTRLSDATVIDQLEVDNIVEAVIVVKNTVDSPFLNNNTVFAAQFDYLPTENDTSKTLIENTYYDNALQTVGAGAVTGDNFSTTEQVMSIVSATFTDATEVIITVRFDLAAAIKTTLSVRDVNRYAISILIENHLLARNVSDKVNLLVDVNEFLVTLTDTNLVTNATTFIQHNAVVETEPDVFPVDDLIARTDFSIDFTDKLTDGIKIHNVINEIVLTHASESDITLESTDVDVSSAILEAGLVQAIDVEQNRGFKFPNTLEIKRNPGIDAGNVYNWYCEYPFLMRWEYWVNLILSGSIPTGIFDSTDSNNNGLNHFWHRYTTVAGWTLSHRLKFNIEQNGELFTQEFDSPVISHTYNGNPDWIDGVIETFDVTTATNLSGVIQGYTDTKVVASFTNDTGTLPLITEVDIVIWIETKEQGGILDIRQISSVNSTTSDSWFKSTDTSNKVVKNKTLAVYTGEALIDYTKLPSNTDYTMYARLYNRAVSACATDGILTEQGDCIITETGDFIIQQ